MRNMEYSGKTVPPHIAVQLENVDANRCVWLSLPATRRKFAAALDELGAKGGNFKIVRYDCRAPSGGVPIGILEDTLLKSPLPLANHFASRLKKLPHRDLVKLCAIQYSEYAFGFMRQLIGYTYRPGRYALLPGVISEEDLGNYHLGNPNDAVTGGMARRSIDRCEYGRKLANAEKGAFSPFGYVTSADRWKTGHNARHIPKSLNLHVFLGEDVCGDYTDCKY